jgi:arylsulfatase A-like enzyme
MARLLTTLSETGLAENTIVVFTSDHGDMIGCQGIRGKHVPWDESIRVPFLFRLPASMDNAGDSANGRKIPLLIDAPDIMPTLLGLCGKITSNSLLHPCMIYPPTHCNVISGLAVPSTVQGRNFAAIISGEEELDPDMSTLLKVPVPYHLLRTQGIT